MKLRSPLVPLVVILLSFGQLVVNGWNVTATLAENLPNPRASTNLRVVDLAHQTRNTGKISDLIFERPVTGPSVLRDDAHLKVQLPSRDRTRILILRAAPPNPRVGAPFSTSCAAGHDSRSWPTASGWTWAPFRPTASCCAFSLPAFFRGRSASPS